MTLGQLVKTAREERGLTQEALAALVGVHRVQVSRIESGARGTEVGTLDKLVTFLGLDPAEALRLAAEAQGEAAA